MTTETRTLCPYCGVGCGLVARTRGDRLREVAGDPLYPVNRGRTCRKPVELPAAVHARDRATVPLLRGSRDARFERAGWDEALRSVAGRLRAIVDEHGPDAIAFYLSGQLLTEDYYAVNKLAKGFLGTNNVDSNSRLCMSSAVAGYTGAFGFDGPPPAYADLEQADCVLLLGTNAAACHPIVWSRIRERRPMYFIVADPRTTPTARAADLHLPVRPGTDLALLNAILGVLDAEGLVDGELVARHASGWKEARAVAREWSPRRAAQVCGVDAEAIVAAARRFGTARAAMALWSMGANQSRVGTLKNRALINLCLATGNVGRPGAGPLSLTGQPNAMGGRETGGLAHLLPGYRRVDDDADRAAMEAHWGSPTISPRPGLPAIELFDALAEGRVRAIWIAATNPVVSVPDSSRVRAALERAELVVIQDAHHPTETSMLAHAVLPAAAWPEKDGTMTNSERRVGLVRAALAPAGEARPDWAIFAALGHELGHGDAFAWPDAAAVFDEFAACTAGRPCDVSGITHARLRRAGSVQWPCPAGAGEPRREPERRAARPEPVRPAGDLEATGTPRLYADRRFPTPDGRARFAPTPHAPPAEPPTADHPLVLTTGRVAEHWHTLTRTGQSPALRAAAGEPRLELHPHDARAAGVVDGGRARIRSRRGWVVARVAVTDGIPRGVAFVPFHWGALHAVAGAGTVNATTHSATDPVSGQPELKAVAVAVEPAERVSGQPELKTVAVAAEPAERVSGPHTLTAAVRRELVAQRASGPAAVRARRRAGARRPRRVVVVGTGMSGLAVVEELLRRRSARAWRIVMLGEEAGPAYNRILVSKLLAGACGPGELALRPAAWYAHHGIDLRGGCPAVSIDAQARTVTDVAGERHPYDALVLATGSRPYRPPVEGGDLPHVRALRTIGDVDAIVAATPAARAAVVVGGGLLGLEAAAALSALGVAVTVVEPADRLMAQQLDRGAAGILGRGLAELRLGAELGRTVAAIEPGSVRLDDGREVPADLVVLAAGVRPEIELARAAGVECARGIVVDDAMRTSAPGVLATGECAEHRGTVYGLWAPLAEQARVAAATVAGDPAAFLGATPATTLKVAGVDVFAGGAAAATDGDDEIVLSDSRRRTYRKLVLRDDRLRGALLIGDLADARRLSELLRTGAEVPEALLRASAEPADPLAPEAVVCSCNQVTRAEIDGAIRDQALRTVAQVGRATGAGTGCGGCARDVEALLATHERHTLTEEAVMPT